MKKSILSFDLTGTLATFSFCDSIYFDGLPTLYAEKNGIAIDQAREHLKRCYDEVGDHHIDWYDITYWFDRLDLGNGWNMLLNDLSHNIEFYPESKAVLTELSQEYELILTTNACREFVEIETDPIRDHFSQIISCVSDFGEVKKTPEFYGRVCQFLDRDPEDIIHIGDHWQFHYVAPSEFGLTAFFLDRTGKRSGDYVIHDLSEMVAKLI